ncbi:helix-turn-helix domain-containing protein [Nocardioides bruguierae]|uniref:XRE family transcriptional regulator n=1 Tax=Nocardioides bruguierae TaxID=2945102 RepID=A0A9X2D8L2_9ACTN|nr:XRE family transcriptional regulator [Nocardioides bruguierae]MCL8025241.1 XRE family transcriptional regulator [Nocardioides bruguierae]MCM0621312.1 XRE family transcriptional regulator [Nocardioides bruguierae]
MGPGESTGARVRALRTERGLSLSALAAAAGVGKATLSQLESGQRNPTLDTLYALAGPLGVPLVALVDAGTDEVSDDALHTRRLHVQTDADRVTEVYLIRLRPGGERTSPAHAAGAVEQLTVLSGTGRLTSAAGVQDLGPGVHVAFAGDAPHAYACTSAEPLVAVDVIVTPRTP